MNRTAWIDVLECPSCRGNLEPTTDERIRCSRCSRIVGEEDGVYDFLDGAAAHPIVARELDAIRTTDSSEPEFMARFRDWLKALDDGREEFDPGDAQSPFLRNALFHRAQIRRLLDGYPPRKGGLLVELGADHCWASGLFIDRGMRVAAVDISDHLKMAPRKDSPMLLRLKADMNALPLKDGSADYVFANACAHHSWDLTRTFREARRVLRPAGRFYLCSEPMPAALRYALFTLFGSFGKQERAIGINETLHSRRRWLAIASSAGFTPVLVFPGFSNAAIRAKLRQRHLPRFLSSAVGPLLRPLQVSVHMIAEKSPASD